MSLDSLQINPLEPHPQKLIPTKFNTFTRICQEQDGAVVCSNMCHRLSIQSEYNTITGEIILRSFKLLMGEQFGFI